VKSKNSNNKNKNFLLSYIKMLACKHKGIVHVDKRELISIFTWWKKVSHPKIRIHFLLQLFWMTLHHLKMESITYQI